MRRALVLVLALAALLAGCDRAADEAALRTDVTTRLAGAMPAGTLAVQSLERRGSQKDIGAPAGETRRVVYYDAELKLQRDYDFGAWDAPGVAGLVSALGTGPRGLSGITQGGNKAGDLVRAHGTVLYRKDGDRWVAVAPEGFLVVAAPDYAAGGKRPAPEKVIEAIRNVIASAPPETSAAAREAMVHELQMAYAALTARVARASAGYAIAAGPDGGQYLRFAQALKRRGTNVAPLLTAGGEENLRLVRAGKASLGLAQGDAALLAFNGEGPFAADGPDRTLRAIGALYPEAVHVVVRRQGGPATVAALAGRRIAVGVQGSASRTTALAVLRAHGVPVERLAASDGMPIGEALAALRDRKVDAVVHVIGFPADTLRAAAADTPVRLLPLDAGVVARMASQNNAWYAIRLPAGTYPSQESEVATLATSAILVVAGDLSDSEVADATNRIYAAGSDLVAKGSAQGAQVSAARASQGLAVPQHAAAARVLAQLSGAAVAAASAPASAQKVPTPSSK